MPFPIQIQRFARLLQKRFGIQGYIALTGLEDVTAMVDLFSTLPEAYFLRGENRHGLMVLAAGVAGQFSRMQLDNPSSNSLVVVERTFITWAGAPLLFAGPVPIVATGGGSNQPSRDSRVPNGAAVTQAANLFGIQAGAQVVTRPAFFRTGTFVESDEGIVLAPGAAWAWELDTVNTQVRGYCYWREVPLAPQELFSG